MYIGRLTHNYILTKKKERNTPQYLLLYLHEKKIKKRLIINEVSGERIVC